MEQSHINNYYIITCIKRERHKSTSYFRYFRSLARKVYSNKYVEDFFPLEISFFFKMYMTESVISDISGTQLKRFLLMDSPVHVPENVSNIFRKAEGSRVCLCFYFDMEWIEAVIQTQKKTNKGILQKDKIKCSEKISLNSQKNTRSGVL